MTEIIPGMKNSVRPFSEQGHYTEVHNLVLDHIMPRVSANAFKVLCLVLRRTKGWKKGSDALSYTQIKEGTGIKADPTVSRAIKELLEGDYIVTITGTNNGIASHTATTFSLNRNFKINTKETQNHATEIEACDATKNEAWGNNYASKNEASHATEIEASTLQKMKRHKERINTKQSSTLTKAVVVEENEPEITRRPPPLSLNSSKLEAFQGTESECALCEICCIDPKHPNRKDIEIWPQGVSLLESQSALAREMPEGLAGALRGFRDWWFSTPTASGQKRQSLYLSNVISHFPRWMQFRTSEVNQNANSNHDPAAAGKRLRDLAYGRK